MQNSSACISVRYRRPENYRWGLRIIAGPLVAILAAGFAGCSQNTAPKTADKPAASRPATTHDISTVPDWPERLTYESWQAKLAGCKSRPVVICVWREGNAEALPALLEAQQWQAQREGSAMFGICLGNPEAWDDKVEPVLRKAGMRAPCMAVAEGAEQPILKSIGLSKAPKGARIVLLDEAGKPVELVAGGKVFEEPEEATPPVAAKTPDTEPAATKEERTPASQSTENMAGTVLVMYSLDLVRLKDGVSVSEYRGTVVWQDRAEKGEMNLRRIGLGRLGHEVAAKISREGAVGVCRLSCLGAPVGLSNLDSKFAEGLTEAISEAGGKAIPVSTVEDTLERAGLLQAGKEVQVARLRNSLDAAFVVTGNLTVSEIDK